MSRRAGVACLVIAIASGALIALLVPGVDRPPRAARHEDLVAADGSLEHSEPLAGTVTPVADRSGAAGGVLVVEPTPGSDASAGPVASVQRAGATIVERPLREGPFDVAYTREEHDDASFSLKITADAHRPYTAPLPTRNESLGCIVLRPGLSYGGWVVDASDRPVEGVEIQIRGWYGEVLATAPATGPDGRFRCSLSVERVTFQSDERGDLVAIKIVPMEPGVSYCGVAGRLEGLAGEHRVRLEREGTLRLRFVTANRAAVASTDVVLWHDGWEQTTQIDRGRTDADGIYEARWPATVDWARVRIATAELKRDFLVRRKTVLATNPLTLVLDGSKSLRLRVVHAASGRAVVGARVTADVLAWPDRESQSRYYERIRASSMPDDDALPAWPRGETDATGRIVWEIGETPDASPRVVRLNGVAVTYLDEQGFPAHEDVDLRVGQAGVGIDAERLVRVGSDPDRHCEIWFRCEATDGAQLTPRALSIDTVADDRPWAVGAARVIDAPFYDSGGHRLWRVRGVRWEPSGMTMNARGTVFRVVTEERGVRRFEIPIAAWQAAASSRTPLTFTFEKPDVSGSVVEIVDPTGKPRPGAVVTWMPYAEGSPYDWTHEQGSATADAEGRISMGHLAPGFPYRIFAFDPRTKAAGRLDGYQMETATGVTRLTATPAQPLGVRVRVPPGAKLSAAGLVTNPRLMLPDVPCRISEDGWIRADPAALECYDLAIGVMFGHRRVGRTFAAAEVQGREIEFHAK